MSEDDFVLSDADDDDNDVSQKNTIDEKSATTKTSSSSKIVTKLSVKEQRKIIEKQHPEMLPLLSHFTTIVEDLQNQTAIASRAIFESEENTAEVSISQYCSSLSLLVVCVVVFVVIDDYITYGSSCFY